MKFELKDFQVTATKALLDRMLKARDAYYRDGDPASCCLASPTGSFSKSFVSTFTFS